MSDVVDIVETVVVVTAVEELVVVDSSLGANITINNIGGGALQLVTAEAIGGHSLIATNSAGLAVKANPSDLSAAHRVLGITASAAGAGSTITVINQEFIDEPSWAWSPGLPLFLGGNGLLTHSPPTSGFLLRAGTAITATRAYIDIQQPIIL
jgi:hypothetical protein